MRVRTLCVTLLAAFCAGIAVAACAVVLLGWRSLDAPMSVPESGEWLTVAPGASLTRVSDELQRREILQLRMSWALNTYGRLSGNARRIQAGEYLIDQGASPRQLLDQLVSGRVHLHGLTIIEGWRFSDLEAALRDHAAVDADGLDPETLMAELGKPGLHPEGQFFPDTYRFPRGTPAVEILDRAHEAMQLRLNDLWGQYRTTTVIESAYDALILASIIEKETALGEERRRVSGVFHRRLERGMRLQADPTVIYGLGDAFDGDLRRADLARDTPYNTYTRTGLPPTPIALPGHQSLSAAVYPAPGPELYFVATGLGDGSHYFSATFEEHRAAVARYQLGVASIEDTEQ